MPDRMRNSRLVDTRLRQISIEYSTDGEPSVIMEFDLLCELDYGDGEFQKSALGTVFRESGKNYLMPDNVHKILVQLSEAAQKELNTELFGSEEEVYGELGSAADISSPER